MVCQRRHPHIVCMHLCQCMWCVEKPRHELTVLKVTVGWKRPIRTIAFYLHAVYTFFLLNSVIHNNSHDDDGLSFHICHPADISRSTMKQDRSWGLQKGHFCVLYVWFENKALQLVCLKRCGMPGILQEACSKCLEDLCRKCPCIISAP